MYRSMEWLCWLTYCRPKWDWRSKGVKLISACVCKGWACWMMLPCDNDMWSAMRPRRSFAAAAHVIHTHIVIDLVIILLLLHSALLWPVRDVKKSQVDHTRWDRRSFRHSFVSQCDTNAPTSIHSIRTFSIIRAYSHSHTSHGPLNICTNIGTLTGSHFTTSLLHAPV